MAISSYTELVAATGRWLNRGDLTANIPDFISLAEAQVKRRLRRTKTRATITLAGRVTTLPAACQELVSIKLTTGVPAWNRDLEIVSSATFSDHEARQNAPGRPRWAMIVGHELLVTPAPDTTYTTEAIYYRALVPLGPSVATNDVLAEAPDVYLYGALKEAEPYLENDERVALWQSKFDAALAELEIAREREEFAASPRMARLPVVFG